MTTHSSALMVEGVIFKQYRSCPNIHITTNPAGTACPECGEEVKDVILLDEAHAYKGTFIENGEEPEGFDFYVDAPDI